MAFTVLDAMGRGHRTATCCSASHEHIFLAYIGMGFAMARLPRRLWRKAVLISPEIRTIDHELACG